MLGCAQHRAQHAELARPTSWTWATTIRIDGRERQRRALPWPAAAIGPLLVGSEGRQVRSNGDLASQDRRLPGPPAPLSMGTARVATASVRVRCRPTGSRREIGHYVN
jgi:hypothetical protein